jgi:hypothetical protein
MTTYADLEIGIHKWNADSYAVELRFSQPGSDAEVRIVRENPDLVKFDLEKLRANEFNNLAYGQLLSGALFANQEVRQAFATARTSAQTSEVPLRVRLFISQDAKELHELRWENLCDPEDTSASLLTSEQLLFSRYLTSLDFRPVRPLLQEKLRALVVIANPTNLSSYHPGGLELAPIDVAGELSRATSALPNIDVTALASTGSATLDTLLERLREGYDILYLVCHGALIQGQPRLWLEDEIGNVAITSGSELVIRLRELQQQPRLIVLASCQSAGQGDDLRGQDGGVLAALGPRLAETGIPAVVAMQGNVTMQTISSFMPVFFRELLADGQIDRAMAVARGSIRERHDYWMPVLFMRLRSGRIWYVPGLSGQAEFDKWDALLNNISEGRCTPILGYGLLEPLLGSSRDIARRWAETYHFPLASDDSDDLPQVAQYLAVQQDYVFPRDELKSYLRTEILRRYGAVLPESFSSAPIEQLLSAVASRSRSLDQMEPHRVIARLPCKIYVTTKPDNLLAEALLENQKHPQVALCPWNEGIEQSPMIFNDDPTYLPSVETPLVYHLFGHLDRVDSLVLTEDDYFDYLIGVTTNKELIPSGVRRALTDSALLFLGFQMDDWNFRVLFRSLMSQQGRGRRKKYAHVAVQIDPQGSHILEPELARRYLERYFGDADISIFWGSLEEFIGELRQRWITKYHTDFLAS